MEFKDHFREESEPLVNLKACKNEPNKGEETKHPQAQRWEVAWPFGKSTFCIYLKINLTDILIFFYLKDIFKEQSP